MRSSTWRDFFKTKDPGKKVNLAVPYLNRDETVLATPDQMAECEVVEFDENVGLAEWQDSVFVQDFSDSVLDTVPAELRA